MITHGGKIIKIVKNKCINNGKNTKILRGLLVLYNNVHVKTLKKKYITIYAGINKRRWIIEMNRCRTYKDTARIKRDVPNSMTGRYFRVNWPW